MEAAANSLCDSVAREHQQPGVSELTASERQQSDPRSTCGSGEPGPSLPGLPGPPVGQACPVPYDGPAKRTRAKSRHFS
ncbi:unnamed protein product [Lampetra planeri]